MRHRGTRACGRRRDPRAGGVEVGDDIAAGRDDRLPGERRVVRGSSPGNTLAAFPRICLQTPPNVPLGTSSSTYEMSTPKLRAILEIILDRLFQDTQIHGHARDPRLRHLAHPRFDHGHLAAEREEGFREVAHGQGFETPAQSRGEQAQQILPWIWRR